MTGIPVPEIPLPVDPSLIPIQSAQDNDTTMENTEIASPSQNLPEGNNHKASAPSSGSRKKKNNRKKSKGSLPPSSSINTNNYSIAQDDSQSTIPGTIEAIDITDTTASNTARSESGEVTISSEHSLLDQGLLEDNSNLNSRDTQSELEGSAIMKGGNIDAPKASSSSSSTSAEDPNYPEALSPLTKPSDTITSTSTTEPTSQEASTSTAAETAGIRRPISSSTASSRSVPITPTSPTAPSHSNLDYSPSHNFHHGYPLHQEDEKQHTSFPSHPNFTSSPNLSQPKTIYNHPGLLETVASHHHLPHHDTTIPLPQQTISPRDSIRPLPNPTASATALHAPAPGVTSERIVMQAALPPPPPQFAHQPQQYSPYLTHPPISTNLDFHSHPPGYVQNPYAAELSPWASQSQRYNFSSNYNNEYEREEEFGGIFGRRTTPLGTSVNTKGNHRRGPEEDVGLVASLMSMWEKGMGWLQEWVENKKR